MSEHLSAVDDTARTIDAAASTLARYRYLLPREVTDSLLGVIGVVRDLVTATRTLREELEAVDSELGRASAAAGSGLERRAEEIYTEEQARIRNDEQLRHELREHVRYGNHD